MTAPFSNKSHNRERRKDLDCLRAIAVLAVVLFHFDIPHMTGGAFRAGFLGVDIFFVISGYLITDNILKAIDTKSFSLVDFYARRVKRLLPAFFVTLAITVLVALWLMTPVQVERLSDSVLYTGVYASNFFFWLESGYFDTSSEYKPLLHTWSLAVEEQFYLFWPLLILFFFKRNLFLWLCLIFVASLVAAELMVHSHPSAVFYLMPFRMFEFAIGALVVLGEHKLPRFKAANFILLVCIGLLLWSFSFYSPTSNIPGVAVVPMLLATAGVIVLRAPMLNSANWAVAIFAWIGRISYSLYLVHWPVVVFFRTANDGSIGMTDLLPLALITLILTLLLHYLVEKPSLSRSAMPRKWLWVLPVGLVITLLFNTLGVNAYKSYREHHRKELDSLLKQIVMKDKEFNRMVNLNKRKLRSGPRVLVVGDSHNPDFMWGLKFAKAPEMTLFSTLSFCDPIFIGEDSQVIAAHYADHKNHQVRGDGCVDFNQNFYSKIQAYKVSTVIFSDRWREESLPYAAETFAHLKDELKLNVLVLGANQEFTFTPGRVLAKADTVVEINEIAYDLRRETAKDPSLARDTTQINRGLRTAAEQAGVYYIDKTSVVCPEFEKCDYLHNGKLTYSDNNHWSPYGMKFFTQRILDTDEFKQYWSSVLDHQR